MIYVDDNHRACKGNAVLPRCVPAGTAAQTAFPARSLSVFWFLVVEAASEISGEGVESTVSRRRQRLDSCSVRRLSTLHGTLGILSIFLSRLDRRLTDSGDVCFCEGSVRRCRCSRRSSLLLDTKTLVQGDAITRRRDTATWMRSRQSAGASTHGWHGATYAIGS